MFFKEFDLFKENILSEIQSSNYQLIIFVTLYLIFFLSSNIEVVRNSYFDWLNFLENIPSLKDRIMQF